MNYHHSEPFSIGLTFGSVITDISPSAHPHSKNLLSLVANIDRTGLPGLTERVFRSVKVGRSRIIMSPFSLPYIFIKM